MKKTLPALMAMLCIAILMNACSVGKASLDQRKSDLQNSKETNQDCFVQLTDGTIRHYTTLKLVTGVLKTPYLLADGKLKIKPAELKAYQNEEHYAISQTAFNFGTPTTYVAVETLPGFAIRIAKGKLNIYSKKFYNGSNAADQFFLQSGNGQFIQYSVAAMNELLKDNNEAVSFFNNPKNTGNTAQKLQSTAAIYNNAQLVSKN